MSQEPALMLNEERPSPSTEAEPPRRRNRVSTIRDYGIVIAFVALFIVLAIASPSFLSLTNMLNILQQNATSGLSHVGSQWSCWLAASTSRSERSTGWPGLLRLRWR